MPIKFGDSFFRVGPTVQLQLNFPKLAFGKSFSITSLYTYLPVVSGPTKHDYYFRLAGTWTLYEDPEINHKISISAEYQRGGLNFSKEEVDQFLVGFSVLF